MNVFILYTLHTALYTYPGPPVTKKGGINGKDFETKVLF